MKPDETESPMVRLQKKVLANLKLKLKGSTSPDINVLVKRDIEALEQKIKRIIEAENRISE
jgi:flagellar capping protein FliD